jgi:hypothetical protein
MKYLILYTCLLLIFAVRGFTQESSSEDFVFDCRTCHACDKPTKKDPCLKECPRAELITIHHTAEEGPGQILMDEFSEISDQYGPVMFSHRVHSEMSEMAGGCALCHHNNPPGHILACRYCHEKQRARTDVSTPDLMAAYHRQCMDCHRAWTHDVSCVSCHALHTEAPRSTEPESTGRIHPKIEEPDRLVYETGYEDGEVVTFYHNEHVSLFGFECRDCHRKESCVRCHDQRKTEKKDLQLHDRCSTCHDTEDDCVHCHRSDIQPPFDHSRQTRFKLGAFHKDLPCKNCHGRKFKRLKPGRACVDCHASWTPETFDHKVTGLLLNEIHREIDCEECHAGRAYDEKPGCTACHEDLAYPAAVPGKRVRLK